MRVALAWSGGAESWLALARLRDAGHEVVLVHLADATTRRDLAHGVVPDFLAQEQATCLGLPLALRACDAAGEEAALLDALRALRPEALASTDPTQAQAQAAAAADLPLLRPLQDAQGAALAREASRRGARAFVCACRPPLDRSLLGRFLDADLLDLAEGRGAQALGAACRTFVVDGPGFLRRVDATAGETLPLGEGWRLDLGLRGC